jgi:hypothetical protein
MVEWNLLRIESYRLKTFGKNWPFSRLGKSSASILAMNGFYYTGAGAKVQCVFCLGIYEPSENLWLIDVGLVHFHTFKTCAFAKGFPCGNIPIKPGIGVFSAFERMPSHLVKALEFEPASMMQLESSMPEGFDRFVHDDSESSDNESDTSHLESDVSGSTVDSDWYDAVMEGYDE